MPARTKTDSSTAAATAQAAFITKIGTERLRIPITGTAPLIVHRWSEKAKRELLESQQSKKRAKEPRNPDAEYEDSLYRMILEVPKGRSPRTPVEEHSTAPQRRRNGENAQRGKQTPATEIVHTYGFPSLAFKSAVVETFRFFDKSVTKVMLMQSVFVHGMITKADPAPLIPIIGEPIMREDVVRIGQNGTQTRYRGEFTEWSATLDLTYVTATLDRNSLLSLVDAAGMFVGVGEWRPEKAGESGTFTLADADIEVVKTPWQRQKVQH
jgi:hypothetical protein